MHCNLVPVIQVTVASKGVQFVFNCYSSIEGSLCSSVQMQGPAPHLGQQTNYKMDENEVFKSLHNNAVLFYSPALILVQPHKHGLICRQNVIDDISVELLIWSETQCSNMISCLEGGSKGLTKITRPWHWLTFSASVTCCDLVDLLLK